MGKPATSENSRDSRRQTVTGSTVILLQQSNGKSERLIRRQADSLEKIISLRKKF